MTRKSPPPTLRVTGRIPEHLDGRYLRNGPNPVAEVEPRHLPLVQRRRHGARGGVARRQARWYRNRWVRTAHVSQGIEEPAPRRARPARGMLAVGPNTNVLSHAGQTLALVEAGVEPITD